MVPLWQVSSRCSPDRMCQLCCWTGMFINNQHQYSIVIILFCIREIYNIQARIYCIPDVTSGLP
jgi:hypothetical protein